MNTVHDIASTPTQTPTKPSFRFEFSKEAAIHNSEILEKHNFDLEAAIASDNAFTPLTLGSELRPIDQLDKLLGHHPNYPTFRQNTLHGIDYPCEDLDKET
jgi:hypothetical protein